MNSAIRQFIPLAVAITLVCGLVYLVGQQNLRMNANDPQIQTSEDLASNLSLNQKISFDSGAVDISKSLASYIMVFNEKGEVSASTARLDGKIPNLPNGIFEYAKAHNQDRFTWQPRVGVRSAAVITYYKGKDNSGFVLAGRSLREVEKREDQLLAQAILGGIVILVSTFISILLFKNKK